MRHDQFRRCGRDSARDARVARPWRFPFELPAVGVLALERRVERFPYVPSDPADRDERCREVYNIQVQGLAQAAGKRRASSAW